MQNSSYWWWYYSEERRTCSGALIHVDVKVVRVCGQGLSKPWVCSKAWTPWQGRQVIASSLSKPEGKEVRFAVPACWRREHTGLVHSLELNKKLELKTTLNCGFMIFLTCFFSHHVSRQEGIFPVFSVWGISSIFHLNFGSYSLCCQATKEGTDLLPPSDTRHWVSLAAKSTVYALFRVFFSLMGHFEISSWSF